MVPLIPSTELTYPTLGKGKSSSKVPFCGDMLVSSGVINPIYSLYSGYLSSISPLKGVLRGLKQLGYHPKGTTIFPMILCWIWQSIPWKSSRPNKSTCFQNDPCKGFPILPRGKVCYLDFLGIYIVCIIILVCMYFNKNICIYIY